MAKPKILFCLPLTASVVLWDRNGETCVVYKLSDITKFPIYRQAYSLKQVRFNFIKAICDITMWPAFLVDINKYEIQAIEYKTGN